MRCLGKHAVRVNSLADSLVNSPAQAHPGAPVEPSIAPEAEAAQEPGPAALNDGSAAADGADTGELGAGGGDGGLEPRGGAPSAGSSAEPDQPPPTREASSIEEGGATEAIAMPATAGRAGSRGPAAAAGAASGGGAATQPAASPAAEALPPLARSTSLTSPSSPFLLGAVHAKGGRGGKPAAAGSPGSPGAHSAPSRSPTQAKAAARDKPPQPKFGDSFAWTASRDLPAEYRAVQEDNKMLAEELRRARQRGHDAEAGLAAAERQLLGLREEVARLQGALRECSVAPAALLQEREFRAQLEQRERTIKQLEAKAAVLERGRESAERRHRTDLACERKAAEAAKAEAAQLKEALAERDRAARMAALHMRGLYQRLEALEGLAKGLPPQPPPQQQQPAPVRAPSPPPEERVHLMLCVVYDKPKPTAAEQAERVRLAAVEAAYLDLMRQREQDAARTIQARYRAFRARRSLLQHREAAMTIQAHVRGMLARRSVAAALEAGSSSSAGEEDSGKPARPLDRLRERRQLAEQRHAQRGAAPRRKGFMASAPGHETELQRQQAQRPRRGSEYSLQQQPGQKGGGASALEVPPRQRPPKPGEPPAAYPRRPSVAQGGGAAAASPPEGRAGSVQGRRQSVAASGGGTPAAAGPEVVPKLALGAGSRSFKASISFKATTPTFYSP